MMALHKRPQIFHTNASRRVKDIQSIHKTIRKANFHSVVWQYDDICVISCYFFVLFPSLSLAATLKDAFPSPKTYILFQALLPVDFVPQLKP